MKHIILFLPVVIVLCFYVPAVQADTVVLTSGTASTSSGAGSANLLGPNFSLQYSGEVPPGATNITMNSVTAGFGTVTLNGVSSNIFVGLISFNDTTLTGNVSAYATMEDLFFGRPALFTTDFVGSGYLTISPVLGAGTIRQFTATAVPEPATCLMLGAGLSYLAARRGRARRSVRSERGSSQ